MCKNKDCFEAYLKDKWAPPEPFMSQDVLSHCAIQHTVPLIEGTQLAAPRQTYRAIFVCSKGIGNLHPAAGT